MAREHVSQKDIANWAADKVNLPSDKAKEYREQVNRLREKLKNYLNDHPDFVLKKMIISGSLAKGTALRSINDIDVGCYVKGDSAPSSINELLDYLAEKLRKAFPNFSPEQVEPQTYSVKVSFRGTGLDVDVVPILYYNDPQWYGNLVSQDDGSFLKTSIPLHLEFIRARKSKNNTHFAQVIRLAKYWVRNLKNENTQFRFKSFMVELIFAKLADNGQNFSDYPEALQSFFTYVAKTDLREQISFDDYYPYNSIGSFSEPVQIIDPVNEENNAAKLYTDSEADLIVDAAIDAGDAIDAALAATTKEKTIYYWKKVFGSSFHI
ncbi:CBASS oligonucleotide cyclase [Aquimarina sp. 2201CG5-10]|uniref:CBASS oligonucleotide cyclase n=1 Tax=Aquimarina callyspongiae TaxID=3098150 RepID=UPI002AB4A5C2|nr:CBASS oligonucleotide cyclase [Aquimarina sp. 2201CG5-10]MDY8134686.1 CBASS oligonucleotide cyclase [Aquimarina sp. 2201CG5-10]